MAHRFKNKKKGRNHRHENKPAGIVQVGRRDPGVARILTAGKTAWVNPELVVDAPVVSASLA